MSGVRHGSRPPRGGASPRRCRWGSASPMTRTLAIRRGWRRAPGLISGLREGAGRAHARDGMMSSRKAVGASGKSSRATAPSRWAQGAPGLAFARLDRPEVAGSFGDLGTLLPLLIAMSVENRLDFSAGLFFAGFFNVVTGLVFAIPMAVQPMKAIAAVAMTEGLTVPARSSRRVPWLARRSSCWAPRSSRHREPSRPAQRRPRRPARRRALFADQGCHAGGEEGLVHFRWATRGGGRRTGGLVLARSRTVPAALVLVVVGVAMVAWQHPAAFDAVAWTLSVPHASLARWSLDAGVIRAALPQVPLTTLNSVVAVCALSQDLFPQRPASPRAVAVSVGVMNLLGAPFGAMPMCHGAGGLAGQYRFGARTSGSSCSLAPSRWPWPSSSASMMGVCPGLSVQHSRRHAGVQRTELALVARDQTRRDDALVAIATAGVALALNNVAIGFVVGLVVALALRVGASGAEDTYACARGRRRVRVLG